MSGTFSRNSGHMPEKTEHRKRQDSLISAEENRAMFDKIAGYYDGTNKILSLGLDGYWRRRASGVSFSSP